MKIKRLFLNVLFFIFGMSFIVSCFSYEYVLNDNFTHVNNHSQKVIKNSMVLNEEYKPISILPKQARGDKDFAQKYMSSWGKPKRVSYHVNLKNSFGDFGGTIVDLMYHIDFQTNGRYEGRGQYIHGVYFSVTDVFIAGGLELNVQTKLLSVSNIGSIENPIPLLLIEIQFFASRLFRTEVYSDVFYISGSGEIKRLQNVNLL